MPSILTYLRLMFYSLSLIPWQEMCNTLNFLRVKSIRFYLVATCDSSLRARSMYFTASLIVLSSLCQLIWGNSIIVRSWLGKLETMGDAKRKPISISLSLSYSIESSSGLPLSDREDYKVAIGISYYSL